MSYLRLEAGQGVEGLTLDGCRRFGKPSTIFLKKNKKKDFKCHCNFFLNELIDIPEAVVGQNQRDQVGQTAKCLKKRMIVIKRPKQENIYCRLKEICWFFLKYIELN